MNTAQEHLDVASAALVDAARNVRECDAQDVEDATKRLEGAADALVKAYMEARREEVGPAPRVPDPAAESLAASGHPRATIFLRDSSTPKRLRYTRWYHKGGCLCVELAGVRDEDGNPVIMEVPHEQYMYTLRPHLTHLGMEER